MKDVIVITGPTASGKTSLAHLVAKSVCGEIIVADSMKVYRGADIASAKPPKSNREEVKYHLLDILEPDQRYDVGSFYKDTCRIINKLHRKKILPIVSGGTSLYITKLIGGLAKIPKIPEEIKNELKKKPVELLYEELKKVDPVRAGQVHPNMMKRIIRALGVYKHTGKRMSALMLNTKPPLYNFVILGINWERGVLYGRINKRVDKMLKAGLVDEAQNLYKKYGPDAPVFEGVGYRQLLGYIKGNIGFEQAVEDIKQATRNYAKSQLTWWRSRELIWLDGEKLNSAIRK